LILDIRIKKSKELEGAAIAVKRGGSEDRKKKMHYSDADLQYQGEGIPD